MDDSESWQYQSDEQRWAGFMANAQQGDETDYRQLLEELAEVINYYLRSRFGSQHFIEDCVQDSLIAIHQARHTYDQRRLFRPWMFAIVRHKTIDTLRQQRSQQRVLEEHGNDLTGSEPGYADARDPQEQLGNAGLIDALPDKLRQAITLTKLMGLSTAEAAGQLGISESAMKVRVHRGVGKLKRLLEADE